MIAANQVPQVDFTEATTIRLISCAYIDEPALAPLADSDGDLDFLEQLEGLTSARRGGALPLPHGVHPEVLLTELQGYGWIYVNATFCYTRYGGNRFNDTDRGAWYAAWGADAAATAQAEVSWHLSRELNATGIYQNITAYRELLAGFTVRFHDLNGCDPGAVLDPDPDVGYPAGQALAARLLDIGSRGLLYPSVRKTGGRCLVAFQPHVVQNIRQGDTWVFTWDGDRQPRIERLAR